MVMKLSFKAAQSPTSTVQSLAISASPLQAVPQTSVIVDLVSANHVSQTSSARLFMVAEAK
jgi:hypothetical protein